MISSSCPDCGRPLPAAAPNGLCPACLLRLGEQAADPEPGVRSGAAGDAAAETFRDGEGQITRIGRYKLLEIIGAGGFGTVWMAEQQEPVRRRVALKIIKLGMDTREVVARFEAERQALALMDHPSIARVFDAGATEAGRPFFVMELVRGLPITDFCDARQLSTRERLELFIPVCQAVQHAHQKGVIHRDLKPSNILVTEQDGRPVPKVIDFGVAKAIEDPLTDKTLFTRFHQFIGTPAYMSPEQAGLGGLDIDTRTDTYALGVLLYELLTGQTPLDSRQLRDKGHETILKMIRELEPPRPSTRLSTLKLEELTTLAGRRGEDPQRLPRLLRGDLDWIVLKALEKDRTRRYESANGLAADVGLYLANEPIAARPPSAAYQFQKAWRRNRLAFTAGLAVALAVVAGLGVSTWLYFREARAYRVSEDTARTLRQSVYASEMNAAYQAWEEGRAVRARDLLDHQRPAPGAETPDLRGFEWRYLWSVTRRTEVSTLTNATTWGFALSEDGQTLAGIVATSGDPSLDWRLRLWSLAERRRIATLSTNGAFLFNPAFSPDGRTLAVPWAPWPRTNGLVLQLWDVDTRQIVKELGLSGELLGVAYSPDGRILAAVGGPMYVTNRPGELRLWEAATGTLLRPPLELPQWAFQVAFSPDGAKVAVSCGDGVARVLEVATGATNAHLAGHNGFVAAVAFTHDGKRLATGDESGYVRLWDWVRGHPETTFKAHDAPIYEIGFTADDQRLVTASRDFTARLWDRHSGEELARFAGHNGGVTKARLISGDQALVTASQDHNVKIWSTRTHANNRVLARVANRTDPRFTTAGRYVAGVDYEGQSVTFWEAATGVMREKIAGQELAASPDGKLLAVLLQTNVLFYDPVELTEIGRVECPSPLGGKPSFSPDGKWLAFRRGDSSDPFAKTRVTIVGVAQRRVVKEIETDEEGNDGWAPVYFARAGRLLLTTRSNTQRTGVWDTTTWQRVEVLEGTPAEGSVVAVSPDGMTFVMSGKGGWLRLWDLGHLKPLDSVNLGAGDIYSLAFDPEGRTLAVGSISGAIRLWNLPARQEVASLSGHRSLVLSLEFSPDGRSLASGSYDKTIRLWRAPTRGDIRAAEAHGDVVATAHSKP